MQAEQLILDGIQRKQLKWYGHLLTTRQEEKRKTATIMEEPSDGHYEKQKHGRKYGSGQISLAFGSGWTALGCMDPNKEKEAFFSNYANNT